MKKFLKFLLVALISVTLPACDTDEPETSGSNTNQTGNNSNSGGSSSDGSSSGGSSSTNSYEKPELSFVDFTATTTSITAKFRIDNQSKAKVSTVKGYYGKNSATSSASASLSGSLITVRISGLSKGTTYYVKCSASGPGGTTTSGQIKLSTLY